MATITNQNDPNRDPNAPVQKTTVNSASPEQANVASANPSASGVPVGSGQFSTLQKYLGANQNAGSRINDAVGSSLTNEANTANTKSVNNINSAQSANDKFAGLTNTTNDFKNQLNQGQTTTGIQDASKGYDANQYNATVSGQQAANDIAANAQKLNQFSNIRDDKSRNEADMSSKDAAMKAQNASANQEAINKQRQKDIGFESNRQNLVANVLNTKNQRQGVQALDNAFVTMDKTNSINNINNGLRSNIANINTNKADANQKQADIAGLNKNQTLAQTDLSGRVNAMNSEYQTILDTRAKQLNAAKDTRTDSLSNQYGQLRDNNEATQDFANLMQLDQVGKANPTKFDSQNISGKMSVRPTMESNDPYDGVRLFNTLNDDKNSGSNLSQLNKYLDTSKLQQKASSGQDVMNQGDINKLDVLSKLMGKNNPYNNVSQFTGEQLGESKLDDALRARNQEFQTKDLAERYTGTGSDSEGINESNGWGGSNQVGTAYGNASATATLDDYLNQDAIYRQAKSTRAGGVLDSINNIGNIVSNPFNTLINNPDSIGQGMQDIGTGVIGALNPTTAGSILLGQGGGAIQAIEDRKRDAINANNNLNANGYLRAGVNEKKYFNGNEEANTRRDSEDQALAQVRSQAESKLNNIGYKNLLKIIKGKT